MQYSKLLNRLFLTAGVKLAVMAPAFAAGGGYGEKAAHAGDDHHGESAGGLPQMDVDTFAGQLFWLFITFFFLYFFFKSKTLPEISGVLEKRQVHIQNDLDTAEKVRKEGEKAREDYEKLMANSRHEASELIKKANQAGKDKADKKLAELQDKAQKDIAALEKSIEKSKDKAINDISDVVASVSADAALKVVGIKTDPKKVKDVVNGLNNKKAAA